MGSFCALVPVSLQWRFTHQAYDEADVLASARDKCNQNNREIGFYQARTIMLLQQEDQAPPSAPPSPPSPDALQPPLRDPNLILMRERVDGNSTAQ